MQLFILKTVKEKLFPLLIYYMLFKEKEDKFGDILEIYIF